MNIMVICLKVFFLIIGILYFNNDVYNKQPDILSRNNFNNYDDDSDEDTDENYLQKLNNNLNQNYIVDFHPECLTHNYDEITILTSVVRDSNNIIIDNLHRTIPFLTKYEKARILGQRAKQINYGAKPLIKIPENIIDGYVIAELELQQKKIPFILNYLKTISKNDTKTIITYYFNLNLCI
jgi:DNA-directed RNA polymerase subunit K/omega